MRRLSAYGKYPETVYRAFNDRTHAEDLVLRGRFRMGNLRTYTEIEDGSRRDPSEGQGHLQRFGMVTTVGFSRDSDETSTATRPGYVATYVELLNPKFLFSCSLPSVDLELLKQRFGRWLVRIDQPRRFAQDVSDYLGTLPHRFAGGVEGCFVQYNKGEKTRRQLSATALTPLTYIQKAAAFSAEKEFRFVVIVMRSPQEWYDGEFLPIDLGRALDYVELLQP